MEQALRWVNNPGVDDRGVGERGWKTSCSDGRCGAVVWFKNGSIVSLLMVLMEGRGEVVMAALATLFDSSPDIRS